MFTLLSVCLVLVTLCAICATASFCKSKTVPVFRGQIQSSSGDSEVMSFNFDFLPGESEESKASKVAEIFQTIQDRRDENHAKWLEIKKQAIEENEAKVAVGQPIGDVGLASVREN